MVEQTHRAQVVLIYPDVEGDVLIKGIHLLGIVAHGIGGALPLEGLVLIQQAGLFAKAVEAVVLLHPAVSHHAVVGVLDEGVAGQGAVQLRAIGSQQLEVDGVFIHHQRHLAGGKGEGAVVLDDLGGKRLHTGALTLEQFVHPILPCGGHQDIGLLCQLVVKACADADDFIGHKADLDICVISMQQESAVFALHAGKTGADLHNFCSSRYILIKNAPIPPQMQDIFREMGATFLLLYPELSGFRTASQGRGPDRTGTECTAKWPG